MIKVKILNPTKGRNEPTFRPLLMNYQNLRNYHIELTDSNDFDFLFIGMEDFINKKVPLQQSIEQGLEFLSSISGDYFLFDGSDSTSLMGAYEVFEQSNAIYLFKNQLLKNRVDYKTPTAFNKWFFGSGSDLDLGYDIPKENWDRIKLSGYNLGWLIPDYHKFVEPCYIANRNVDLLAVYQHQHNKCYDHNARNDIFYTKHRSKPLEILKDSHWRIKTGTLPKEQYLNTLYQSIYALSPFGMGEICYRDFEVMQFGVTLIKPDMGSIKTLPNPYLDDTYVKVKHDWSDLQDVIDRLCFSSGVQHLRYRNFREIFKQEYTSEKLCLHWYDIFSNLDTIKTG